MMEQLDLLEPDLARSLLDQLLEDSRLYKSSEDYKRLLDFVVRLRNFAPFNAMLLQVQKPGLLHAASSRDWRERFGREIKEGARPLLILWPFGPVALVYDVADTEGPPLPESISPFAAKGHLNEDVLIDFAKKMDRKNIAWHDIDSGEGKAGSISVVSRATKPEQYTKYKVLVNRNHDSNVRFATLAHELGHLFLGHLGKDKRLNIPDRSHFPHARVELEAESVSYLVCQRSGIKSKSEAYLCNYVEHNMTVEDLDLYQVMRAAGQVETLLGLGTHSKY